LRYKLAMASNLITMIFSILAAVLLVGSVAAMLLEVSAVTMANVAVVLLALLLMFTLGVFAGGRRIRVKRFKDVF
jgi:hypothetical protein